MSSSSNHGRYNFLFNEQLLNMSEVLHKKMSSLVDPEELYKLSFCYQVFKKCRIAEICTENLKKPIPYYEDPKVLPDIVEAYILDFWFINYCYMNSFSSLPNATNANWRQESNEMSVGLLAKAGWQSSNIAILVSNMQQRGREYFYTFELSLKKDSRNSFKFGEAVIRNVFGESEIKKYWIVDGYSNKIFIRIYWLY